MDKKSEMFILGIAASILDVANSKNNSHLTQLKTEIMNDEGKMKRVRIIIIPEDMQIDFVKPLGAE